MSDIKPKQGKNEPRAAPCNMSTPSYLFLDQVINPNDDKDSTTNSEWSDSFSPHERLRFVLNKLQECNVPEALFIPAQHQVSIYCSQLRPSSANSDHSHLGS